LGVDNSIPPDELELGKKHKLIVVRYGVEDSAQILQSFFVADRGQGSKGIALASRIVLLVQEVCQKVCCIW
jgi:hypothetical protein